jgi:hypothetical protein
MVNKTLTVTVIVIAVIALAAGVFFVGFMYARNVFGIAGPAAGSASNYGYGPGMMNGYGGPGMMRGRGNHGLGMMNGGGGYGPGGMMGGRGGYGPGGMMGGYGYGATSSTPLSVDQAKSAAGKYLANLNNPDLKIAEIMVFDNNAYVAVKESSTGIGAFELLVDPATQTAFPEYGPNMMWNQKYGAINHQYIMGGCGGMMRGFGWNGTTPAQPSGAMTVSSDQAIAAAQKYLDANLPGTSAATDPMQFYGYYTLDFTRDGKVAGMLSVDGYSGQVFLHTWHGNFIEEAAIQ